MNSNSDFLNPRLAAMTLDRFIVRHSILTALSIQLGYFKGVLLDIGCGNQPYKSLLLSSQTDVTHYIGLDIPGSTYYPPDVYWDGKIMPFSETVIDCAIATEVLEHIPDSDCFLNEVYRVLKPGGFFFFTVPFLWPLHDVPHDEYRYTPFALERYLSNVGFRQIHLEALGGWDASLAQMVGLWVRRRPMSSRKRAILSRLALPVVRYLISIDHIPKIFGESTMITGISGTAIKPIS